MKRTENQGGMTGKRLRAAVPAKFIVPIIQQHLETTAEEREQLNHGVSDSTDLADKAGICRSTLTKYLNGNRQYMPFDIADRLMTAMEKSHLWWEWPLLVFYLAVDLSGEPVPIRVVDQFKSEHACKNGHERTPENTILLKSGKIKCRICNNDRSARGYHRRRSLVAA